MGGMVVSVVADDRAVLKVAGDAFCEALGTGLAYRRGRHRPGPSWWMLRVLRIVRLGRPGFRRLRRHRARRVSLTV